jgi:hypothetical protein
MSPYAYLAAAVIVSVTLGGTHWKAYTTGERAVQGKWDKANLDAERIASIEALRKQEKINVIDTKRVVKAAKSRQIAQSNAEKVDQYAPVNSTPLPGAFRVWHDAAADGTQLDDSSRANAASVSLKETETVIADNYASCNYDKFRLESLQEIVKAMTAK